MTNSSVGKHWTHQRFVQNLVNASRARELKGAAKEWSLYKLHVSEESQNCQLCNTRINACVTLKNTVNGNFLVLGEECYDKLLVFLRNGKVESSLPYRKAASGKLRTYWKKLIKQLPDRTVVGWLREELDGGQLAGDIAEIVYTITHIGFAPTTSDADNVVSFYKSARKFPIANLLERYALCGFRHLRLLPKTITINQIDRVKKIIAKDKEIKEKHYEAEREIAETKWLLSRIENAIKKLGDLCDKLRNAATNGVTMASTSAVAVEKVIKQISDLAYNDQELDSLRDMVCQAESLAEKTVNTWQWNLSNPEAILSVKTRSTRYILVLRDGRWRCIWRVEGFKVKDIVSTTGIYMAIVLEGLLPVKVKLLEQLDSSGILYELDFNKPSRNMPGAYVAELNGKIVLPSGIVKNPGTYKAFILGDEGRYYRAWVI